jgi:DNA-binding transcriptional ArsR family regulator
MAVKVESRRKNDNGMAIQVEYNGNVYRSKSSLCKATGISPGTLANRLNNGLSVEQALAIPFYKEWSFYQGKIVYQGTTYANLSELARGINIEESALSYHLRMGLLLEEILEGKTNFVRYTGKVYTSLEVLCSKRGCDLKKAVSQIKNGASLAEAMDGGGSKNEVLYKGKTYPSLSVLAEEKGVSYLNLLARLKITGSVEKAIDFLLGKGYTFRGKDYKSIVELAKDFGVSSSLVSKRLGRGYTLEDAVTKPPQVKGITYEGKFYASIVDLANEKGLDPKAVYRRLDQGYTLERALSKPVRSRRANQR